MSIPVVHYESERVSNPNPMGETPAEEFYEVRASLLSASQRFGETGPESKSSQPHYWIVEDQYNDELYQYMEVYEPVAWQIDWLLALAEVLREHQGWGIGISVYEGYLLVFADRVMVNGPTFAHCRDLDSVVVAAKEATERFHEQKYGPLDRQLAYVQGLLPGAMRAADATDFVCLATFDRYQLHDGHAIWILQTKRRDEIWLDIESAPIRETAVTADGTIHSEYCRDFWPYTDAAPPYWLLTYLVENKAQRGFKLVDENGKQVGTLTIERVIMDDELKARNFS